VPFLTDFINHEVTTFGGANYAGFRWSHIKDTWIGFSVRKIAKQAVASHIFMVSWMMGFLKW